MVEGVERQRHRETGGRGGRQRIGHRTSRKVALVRAGQDGPGAQKSGGIQYSSLPGVRLRAAVVGHNGLGTDVVVLAVICALQFFEACHGLASQGAGILGDAHLAGALDLRASTVECVDDLAEREDEARSLDVRY